MEWNSKTLGGPEFSACRPIIKGTKRKINPHFTLGELSPGGWLDSSTHRQWDIFQSLESKCLKKKTFFQINCHFTTRSFQFRTTTFPKTHMTQKQNSDWITHGEETLAEGSLTFTAILWCSGKVSKNPKNPAEGHQALVCNRWFYLLTRTIHGPSGT